MSQQIKVDQIADVTATSTELNYTDGVTSSIQTQLDAKLPLAGGTLSGDINGNGNKVLFANVYTALTDLPSASTYHGMFAHVHNEGKAYYAHGGNWVPLANASQLASVGDGGLSEINFTSADHSKLNGIEASADVTATANVVSALTAGTGITIAGNGTIATTVTATTSASDLTSGTLADARFPATLPAISGASLTNLPAATEAPKLVEECTNSRGAQIPQMVAVYAKNKQGTRLGVDVAHYQTPATMPAVGITPSAINAGQNGDVVTQGRISGLDTSSFTLGDTLYVSSIGNLTATKPTGNNELTQAIAKVTNVNASTGEIYVFGPSTPFVNNLEGYLGNGRIYIGDSSDEVSTTTFASAALNAGLATSSTLSNYMPLSGGTFTGNVQFGDDDQAIFGAGSDLFIKSDGTNALIQGAGTTYIRGSTLIFSANGGAGGFETGIRINEVSAETSQVELYYDNGLRLETVSAGVEVTGDLVASGNVTAYSDERLKDNIETIDNALNKVEAMRGVTFTKDGGLSSGVIAQEIEQVAPELVIDGQFKSVAYGNLVGYLIEAIKELSDKVKELEAR